MAEGRLLDLIRRLYCFGISLLKMDVRQESSRHTEAIDSITRLAVCIRPWEYAMLRPDVMLQAVQKRKKQVAASVVKLDSQGNRCQSQPHCEIDSDMSRPHCQASSLVLQPASPCDWQPASSCLLLACHAAMHNIEWNIGVWIHFQHYESHFREPQNQFSSAYFCRKQAKHWDHVADAYLSNNQA